MMKNFFLTFLEKAKEKDAGVLGATIAFLVALIYLIFGFWKTIFLFIFTFIGYYIGNHYFNDEEELKNLLDKLFPPGKHH